MEKNDERVVIFATGDLVINRDDPETVFAKAAHIIKQGDIVTGINGGSVKSAADMEKALAGLKPGNIVTILFLRTGETRKSEIVI